MHDREDARKYNKATKSEPMAVSDHPLGNLAADD
jgi:hypothetical protein